MPVGGARRGAGRPRSSRKSIEELKRTGSYRPGKHGDRETEGKSTLDIIGPSPRRQLLHFLKTGEGSDPGVRTDGGWLAEFTRTFCVLTKPPNAGEPFVLEPHELAFLTEALEFDDRGNRIFATALAGWPRKNGKSTLLSAFGLAEASSSEGESWPDIPLAAGSKDQAGELFSHARAFVEANEVLSGEFDPMKTMIEKKRGKGGLWRVAADGRLQHSLNPYVVIGDEIHAWTTPKQEELYTALKTAFGARENGLFAMITTAGWDMSTILGVLYQAARSHPDAEPRPDMGGAGFVLRDIAGKVLVHWYGISPDTTFDDLDAWVAANPASWRTRERIAADLADTSLDESSKRRLYGNQWTAAKNAWITPERWGELGPSDPIVLHDPEWIPSGSAIMVGGDGALVHDTTAIGWAWKTPDGKCRVRARVWSARREAAHHELHEGRIDNEAGAEAFVRDSLMSRYHVQEFAYDPRYLEEVAKHLGGLPDGPMAAEVQPSSVLMDEATNLFFGLVMGGKIEHDGDPVLAAHVAAAVATKIKSGSAWRLDKAKTSNPMDALIAVILATWRCMRGDDGVWVTSW